MPDLPQAVDVEQTDVGSYFVANYPPFSVWTRDAVAVDGAAALASPPAHVARPGQVLEDVPLGLYLHIPFCRKRCHFCYFRVYTDKNAREVEQYLEVLAREWDLYQDTRAIAGRPLNFVYFGGGTPSFLSTKQLEGLVARLDAVTSWRNAEEVTRAATHALRRHCRNFKTLTFDNGTEFHDYAVLEQRFPVKVYFATPYHAWERSSNENFNGLLRQY